MTVKKTVVTATAPEVPDLALHRGLGKAFWNDGGDTTTTDTESGASSSTEEVESPRSARRWWRSIRPRKKAADVHSQVLRVREEDSYVGEDISAVGSGNGFGVSPALPCSRLSHHAATSVNTASVW